MINPKRTIKEINKNKCRHQIGVILSGVLLLVLLAGCNNAGTPNVNPIPQPVGSGKTSDATSVTPTAEATNPALDVTLMPTSKATPTPTMTPTPTPDISRPSLEKFLRTSLMPVGSTLYIWGGGWNEEDTGAGIEARTIGLSNAWREFFDTQNESYDYKKHDYEIHNGLDCSGFVGWAVYNTLEAEDGMEGYVCSSTDMAGMLADKGLGSIPSDENKSMLCAGDIVSMDGHVYIAIGTCDDGSALIVHSSPPGVRISGINNADGSASEATQLAYDYTKTHYPEWFERYGDISDYGVSHSYYSAVKVFRWSKSLFEDYDELTKLSPKQLLEKLSTLWEGAYREELTEDVNTEFLLNTGDSDVMASAEITVEHMIRFDSDSRHEAQDGYEWITFNCRISSDDENAMNNGYTYMPFISDRRDILSSEKKDDGFECLFHHINSGVYEDENGKRYIADTFSCEVCIPKYSTDYVFGLLNTEGLSEGNNRFTGGNALVAYTLNAERFSYIGNSVEELLKSENTENVIGKYVYYGSMDTDGDGETEPLIWYVLDADENEVLLMSRDILFLKDNNSPEMTPKISSLKNLTKSEFTTYLWKNGSGYDTIAAAAPTKRCLDDMISLWGNDGFTDLVYYTDYKLSEAGMFAGADGVGFLSDSNGSLLDLLGVRPCVKIKIK